MPLTLSCIQCREGTSVLQDQRYICGVRSLLIIEKVLMKNDLVSGHAASNHQHSAASITFFIRHSQAC